MAAFDTTSTNIKQVQMTVYDCYLAAFIPWVISHRPEFDSKNDAEWLVQEVQKYVPIAIKLGQLKLGAEQVLRTGAA
jgi:hypothetical protein